MIFGYAKTGRLDEARKLFDEMPERDNFSWSVMISGNVRKDRPNEALELYKVMQRHDNYKCNKFTVSSALAASAAIPCLHIEKEIYGHIMRTGLDSDAVVWGALSDMYGKCGSIEEARHIFYQTMDRDVVSWTAMISRYFEEKWREEGFAIFMDLIRLVSKGFEYFHLIKEKHGLTYTADHYACVIDLLARSGRFKEAEDIIDEMPIKADKFLWALLLGGCRIHRA
ncbi:hypothetical protein L1049_016471 [Liquidambar formosana]|uniref:Pentatricopeptide repeat-containing protein n=1 Tax=Liquidambar formosana TaxID=63359 RepID=A0AAP0X348_LIQFO